MQLPPDLVIFDCDGVLVDSETITNAVMRDNIAGYGLELTLPEIMSLFVGGTMPGVMQIARDKGAALPDDWLDEIYTDMFDALRDRCEVIPGIVEVLDQLDAAGIPYAVGSNGPHEKMDITLNKTGLMERFQGRIVSRIDVPNPKPAPDVYLRAAEIVGIAPERCVVVDDSPSGAKAGQAAGMYTFGFAADTDPVRLAPVTDSVFTQMSQLPGLLKLG